MLKLESNDTSCAHRSLRKYKAAKLCKYDFKFPWPVVIVVNIGVIFIFIFSLSCITGKKSFVICAFVVSSHSLCHFIKLPSFNSLITVLFGIFL